MSVKRAGMAALLLVMVMGASPPAAWAQAGGGGQEPRGEQASEVIARGMGVVVGSPSFLGLRLVMQRSRWGFLLESADAGLSAEGKRVSRAITRLDVRRMLIRKGAASGHLFGGVTWARGMVGEVEGSFLLAGLGLGGQWRYGLVGTGPGVGVLLPLITPNGSRDVTLIAEWSLLLYF